MVRSYSFVRADLPADRRVATVRYDASSQSGAPIASVFSQEARPSAIPDRVDLVRAFGRVESGGGHDVRAAWELARRPWSAEAALAIVDGVTVVNVSYGTEDRTERAEFRYDPRTNTVKRL